MSARQQLTPRSHLIRLLLADYVRSTLRGRVCDCDETASRTTLSVRHATGPDKTRTTVGRHHLPRLHWRAAILLAVSLAVAWLPIAVGLLPVRRTPIAIRLLPVPRGACKGAMRCALLSLLTRTYGLCIP